MQHSNHGNERETRCTDARLKGHLIAHASPENSGHGVTHTVPFVVTPFRRERNDADQFHAWRSHVICGTVPLFTSLQSPDP
jgi:hypothetical protein